MWVKGLGAYQDGNYKKGGWLMDFILSTIDGFVGLFSGGAVWIEENFVFLLVLLLVLYALYKELKKDRQNIEK